MAPPIVITTPMPTLNEVGRDLGLTRTEQDYLIRLVDRKVAHKTTTYAFKTKSPAARIRKAGGEVRKTKNGERKTA